MTAVSISFDNAITLMSGLLADHSLNSPVTILVDGPSGSGKTNLTNNLKQRLESFQHLQSRPIPVEFISMEDLYEGWSGLKEGHKLVTQLCSLRQQITESQDVSSLQDISFSPWDWHQNRRIGKRILDPYAVWIIEGCGSINTSVTETNTLTFWVHKSVIKRFIGVWKRERVNLVTWLRWEYSFWKFSRRFQPKERTQYKLNLP